MGGVRPLALPKTARLTTQREYDRVHATGLRFHGRFVAARVELLPAARVAESQLGLRVAKRHGNAVLRNRIKRLLREGFRRSRAGWPAPAAVVLMPKTTAWPELKLRDLQDDFERLGRQIARWAEAAASGTARRGADGRRAAQNATDGEPEFDA